MQLSPPAIPQQSLFTHSEHSWVKVESASPLHVLQPGEALQRLTHQRKKEKRNSHQPDRRLIVFSSGCLREIKAGLWCSSAVGSVLRWLAGPDSPAFVSQRCPLPRPDSHSHRDSALDLQRWQWPHFDSHPPAPSLIGPRTCRSLRHGARIESAPAAPSRAGAPTAAPHCDWSPLMPLLLYKCVTAFTWKPTATAGVREARANHYDAAAGEWSSGDGWLTAAQSGRLLSKRLYKCAYDQCGWSAQSFA